MNPIALVSTPAPARRVRISPSPSGGGLGWGWCSRHTAALLSALALLLAAPAADAADSVPTAASGRIERLAEFPSRHVPPRHVEVWLPEGYPAQAPYAVLYMHDGQMLFDATGTWNHQEWRVDEVAGELIAAGTTRPFLVVGVWHRGPERRAVEYFPQKVFESLDAGARARLLEASLDGRRPLFAGPPESDRYLKFLIEELKPHIDRTYAVSAAREDTFVLGSSLGGLISLYALAEYPEVFAGAAALSPHWPGGVPGADAAPGEALLAWFEAHLPPPGRHRLWLDHGTATLDAHYAPWQRRMDAILCARGWDQSHWTSRVYPGAAHDENAWAARLPEPITFLLGSATAR